MNIQRRHVGALAALLIAGALCAPGCADNESSIFIRGAMAVPSDTCSVTADPSAAMKGRGAFDTALAAEYSAVLLVGNQLVRRGSTTTLRTETSRVQFVEADVTLTDGTGNQLAAFRVPVSGFADPGTSSEPGYGLAQVVLVDAVTAQALDKQAQASNQVQEVIASVIVRGHTLGGNDVESGAWNYPISTCHRCLLQFPGDADDATKAGPDCDNRADAPTNCHIGIDDLVDCRTCSAVNQACEPTGK
jgi:hypothetical protein